MKKRFLLRFASYSVAVLATSIVVSRSMAQTNTTSRPTTPATNALNLPAAFSNAATTLPVAMATTPPATTSPQGSNADGKLQIYDVPAETAGTLAAQLQLQYASEKRIRITTEPNTGRLLILAPDQVHQAISSQIAALKANSTVQANGGQVPATVQQSNFKLQKINAKQLEEAINRLAGNRLSVVELGNNTASLRLITPSGPQELFQIERATNTVKMSGPTTSVFAWNQVVAAIDLGQADLERPTQIVPISPATPERIEKAVKLVKFASYQQDAASNQEDETVARIPAGNQTEQATVIGSPDSIGSGTGLIGDVEISFVNELGLVILKGNKKDVERVMEVIKNIKDQSKDTQPDIELISLKHVNSQALSTIISDINTTVFAPRQGQVSITPLGQPNALLLIGRKEAMTGLLDLINKLDTPLDPKSQLQVYKLLHTSSVDAETLIRNFFSETGSGGTGGAGTAGGTTSGLAPRVKVVSDYRTNSLIVQASPRDLAEVAKLIAEIDVESSPAESQLRVIPVKNVLASELVPILTTVISGQSTGTTTGGNQGGGGGNATGGSTSSRASTPSGKISISNGRNGELDSGILAGVVITTSQTINALVVRAPAKSMPLIAALIEQLDAMPSADARIKVFPVINGDATALALTLQQVFGLPATAGASNTNPATVGLQNLAALTSGGESSLVPLRVTTDLRTNSIIASGSASDLEVIEALLYRLDDQNGQQRSNEVVWLRNSAANDVAIALNNLLNTQRTVINQQLQTGQQISLFERVDREVFIVAEPATNSLIISATPRYMQQIREIVTRLDRQQPMIAVEMLVAEVTLDDNFELGNEFGIQDSLLFDRGSASGGTLNSPAFNQGPALSNTVTAGRPQNVAGQGMSNFAMGRTSSALGYGGLVLSAGSESVNILFRALQDHNRVQILSRPNLLTIDNNISIVKVGQLVPRIASTGSTQFGQQNNQVNDADVGLIMQIQPRTNQDGLINMIVAVNRSSLGNTADGVPIGFGPNGEPILSPIISQTLAQTRVTAYDGQTVVLGGLISKFRSSRSRRVPLLSSIPIAGALFRFDSESETRSELLIVMTPRVINNNDSEKLDMLKHVESSRMSWCMADILNIHGDVGLSPGNGLWGPAASPVIFPDMNPTAEFDPTRNPNVIIGEPEGAYLEGQPPVIYDPDANKSILKSVPSGDSSNPMVTPASPLQNTSYQAPMNQNVAPYNSGVTPASYRPVGPEARIASPTGK